MEADFSLLLVVKQKCMGFELQLGKEITVCEFITDQLMIMFMEACLVDVEFVHGVDWLLMNCSLC